MNRSTAMHKIKALPILGLFLLLAGALAHAGVVTGAAPVAGAEPGSRLLLLDDSGADPLELRGDALTVQALQQAIASMRGASQVLVLRTTAGEPLSLPIESVLRWLDSNAAERLVLVLELRSSGGEAAACDTAAMAPALSSKARLVLICGVTPVAMDGSAPRVGVLDAAIAGVIGRGGDSKAPPATAYGLPAALDTRIAAGLSLSAYLRGRDWPLPMAGMGFQDKLDPALVAVSGPELAAADSAARLSELERAGVGVRHGENPAVSVRIIATSADAAAGLRAAVEQAGGEISVAFDNTLFALIPVSALRRLAASADIWTMEPNRRMSQPFRSRNPE